MIRQILSGRLIGRHLASGVEAVNPATIALLFAADRLDHLHAEIVPLLQAGTQVISDRYLLSSLAYQGLETDLSFVRQINALAKQPDLTIYLQVRPEAAMERIANARNSRDSFENLPFLQRCAAAYDTLVAQGGLGPMVTINGELEIEEVTRQVREAVHLRLFQS